MENQVTGHAWLQLAAAQGHEDAEAVRNDLAVSMTPAQQSQAQEIGAELQDRIESSQSE